MPKAVGVARVCPIELSPAIPVMDSCKAMLAATVEKSVENAK
jgi:hypothetical protein